MADRVVVMNGGRIEQVGPPQELYHNPTTRFVAGFIGSPAMNFLPCRLQNGGASLSMRLADGTSLPIPPARTDRYAAYKDKEMVLGLRPEHLYEYHDDAKPGVARLDAPVDVVEPMGMETLVHFFVSGTRSAPASIRRHPQSTTDAAALGRPQPHAPDGAGYGAGGLSSPSPANRPGSICPRIRPASPGSRPATRSATNRPAAGEVWIP